MPAVASLSSVLMWVSPMDRSRSAASLPARASATSRHAPALPARSAVLTAVPVLAMMLAAEQPAGASVMTPQATAKTVSAVVMEVVILAAVAPDRARDHPAAGR